MTPASKALIDLRSHSELTQHALAHMINKPVTAISRWENGRNITLYTLMEIADKTNTELIIRFKDK